MRLPLPGTIGVTLYRSAGSGNMGAFLRFNDPDGLAALEELLIERDAIEAEFAAAGLTGLSWRSDGEDRILSITHPSLAPWDEAREAEQRDWLGRAASQFVNSLRPRLARITG